ncbi:hypothetical protein BDV96DRAFT_647276 [Lophiotrema nucula]|uniref:Uncharacterized protein n=1 Tax=Lophiotrema nucula TaxID=690887 RepID=A0A6A5Z564_9PLEO|nr:hypothetical protein BDV96DRAFT_647276 [Lophiotrema nucula]
MNATIKTIGRWGWVDSPSERGTLDIVWSCVLTIFFCLWSVLHLNVPAPTDTFWTIFWRTTRWMILGILAPELPMLIAAGQWASAKRSVGNMKELGFTDSQWSLEHAFYADSGGFVLLTADGQSTPLTAKQVHFLVQKAYISLPALTKREIWDKSSADKLAKSLACFQTAWLTINVIGRAIQHLAISPMELSTIALALTSLATL